MAYIRGSPPQEPRSSEEASEEETESDEALARRLQAEEQGRPVARFELLDHVEARYKDPELRGGTWSRDYYAAPVVAVSRTPAQAPSSASSPRAYAALAAKQPTAAAAELAAELLPPLW